MTTPSRRMRSALKREEPASDVYRIKDEPAAALAAGRHWPGRRQARMAALAPLLLRNRQRFHIVLT
jgi:hypothetical protein